MSAGIEDATLKKLSLAISSLALRIPIRGPYQVYKFNQTIYDMDRKYFFRIIRFLCKNGGVCLYKNVVYVQSNSKYIENNYENSDEDTKPHTDE